MSKTISTIVWVVAFGVMFYYFCQFEDMVHADDIALDQYHQRVEACRSQGGHDCDHTAAPEWSPAGKAIARVIGQD
ncbi:hypothetical protein [Burkholderia gladioli]|uniref:hypothetical protein n=1 Tax=Burkholderia gladioli TaxID=28095 RepID=UPI00163E70DB|nr:hypothetical protein [Burkholderia gladioli]